MDQVDFRPVNLVFTGLCSKGFRHATRSLVWLQPDDRRSHSVRLNVGGGRFSKAGIEGLFANLGFSGLGDSKFALRPVVKWAAVVGSVPLGRGGVECRQA